jgi:hypothetical protein
MHERLSEKSRPDRVQAAMRWAKAGRNRSGTAKSGLSTDYRPIPARWLPLMRKFASDVRAQEHVEEEEELRPQWH